MDQVTVELKHKVSAKTQRFSIYRKSESQYYQNEMFRTDCKKFYNLPREKNTNVQNAPSKEEKENFWKEIFGKKFQHNIGSKTSANKIPIWKKVQYLKWMSQRY